MLLKDKNAVIYGAGGAIDSAVAAPLRVKEQTSFLLVTPWRPSSSSPRGLLPLAEPPRYF